MTWDHERRAGPVHGEPEPDAARVRHCLRQAGLDAAVVSIQRFVARRPVFLATLADGTALILKWRHDAPELRSDNERFWLHALAASALPAMVRAAVPRIVAGDEDGPLILDALPRAQTLAARLTEQPEQPVAFWVAFAAGLSSLHGMPVSAIARRDRHRKITLPLPSTFDLGPEEFACGCGTDFGRYVTVLQSLAPLLDELRRGWRQDALIHFDLGGDNVLLGGDGEPPVRMIDWELAGVGDPMYDVGSVLGHLLTCALRRSPGLSAARAPADVWLRTDANARRFLGAYGALAEIDDEDLLRAVRFAGLAQLMTALGRLERIGTLGRSGHLALVAAESLLRHPESASALLPTWARAVT